MASIENTEPDAAALQAMCDAARAIVERAYSPRPGAACATAPDGVPYLEIKSAEYKTPIEAVQELESWLRAAVVKAAGDTVWWRKKPMVEQHPQAKVWRARCRLRLGWVRDEMPSWTPGKDCEYGAAYPDVPFPLGTVGAPDQARLQLPRWKCHKVVEAAKITGCQFGNLPVLVLDSGDKVEVSTHVWGRIIRMLPAKPSMLEGEESWTGLVGGYFVRYPDGFESWSPADAFEGGYTREGL